MPTHIPLAMYGTVELEDSMKYLYEHNLVQRLRWLSQLSEKVLTLPSATQNCLTHSLRVYSETQRLLQFRNIGDRLEPEIKRILPAFALVHDTPHSALRHTLEPFFGNHDEGAAEIVNQLRYAVEYGGYDFGAFKALFLHEHPAHQIVSDKNFGTDKLDYLKYDTLHAGVGNILDSDAIERCLAFRNNQMMAHISAIEAIKDLQKKYLYSYLHLYCSPETMTWQRLTQKIAWYCLNSSGIFTLQTLRWLTDVEFWGKVAFAAAPQVQELYQIVKHARAPEVAIEFLPQDHINLYNKKPWHFTIKEHCFVTAEHWRKIDAVFNLESEIAKFAGMWSWQILLVSQDQPSRFVPTDCTLFNDNGEEFSLFSIAPKHLAAMQESSRQSMFIRIAIVEKEPGEAEKVRKAEPEIRRFLKNEITKIVEAKASKPA